MRFSCPHRLPPPPASFLKQAGASDAHGVTIDNHLTTLPLKKGLSSSAAVCVLVVRALCLAYGLELSVPQVRWAPLVVYPPPTLQYAVVYVNVPFRQKFRPSHETDVKLFVQPVFTANEEGAHTPSFGRPRS